MTRNQEPFAVRGVNFCESLLRHTPEQLRHFLGRMAGWRMNTALIHAAYGYRRHRELLESHCREHEIAMVYYLQTSLLFLQEAPSALFAKNRDGTPRTPHLCNETRLCASDPAARDAFRAGARRFFATLDVPRGSKLLLMDADGYLFCQCPGCADQGPVEQWAALFEIAVEEGARCGRDLAFWYLSYVWRYRMPRNMRVFEQVETVLFDTHQRCRWASIGGDHALSVFNELEGTADPQAADMPLNRYLDERLRDWRRAFSGQLVVFENLMIQGSISCPQPYTPQLLEDLERYAGMGVDGVVLEAFEPGVASFESQISMLASRMAGEVNPKPQPTGLEAACEQFLRHQTPERFNYKNQFNVLAYLTDPRFDGLTLLEMHQPDPLLHEYAGLLRAFLLSRSAADCAAALEFVLRHKGRFDWAMIGFNLPRAVEPGLAPCDPREISFLTCDKLWDWMEERDEPLALVENILRGLIASMRQSRPESGA